MTNSGTRKGDLVDSIISRLEDATFDKVGAEAEIAAEANAAEAKSGHSVMELAETEITPGTAALVIGGGPSLYVNDWAQSIRNSGFKGAIIATEPGMVWCFRNGIRPDIVVTLDPHADRILRYFGDPTLTEEKLANDDYFVRQASAPEMRADQMTYNNDIMDIMAENGAGLPIAMVSLASRVVVERTLDIGMNIHWWNPIVDDPDEPNSLTRRLYEMNHKPCLNTLGNSGSFCWVLAHSVLSKTQIGLLGMDFSYHSECGYMESQYYTELKELVSEDKLSRVFTHIVNPYLDREFIADPTYLWYRDSFLHMARMVEYEGGLTYNCTEGGILFGRGVEFVTLNDFLSLAS